MSNPVKFCMIGYGRIVDIASEKVVEHPHAELVESVSEADAILDDDDTGRDFGLTIWVTCSESYEWDYEIDDDDDDVGVLISDVIHRVRVLKERGEL